jgi:hypothetical protein
LYFYLCIHPIALNNSGFLCWRSGGPVLGDITAPTTSG